VKGEVVSLQTVQDYFLFDFVRFHLVEVLYSSAERKGL